MAANEVAILVRAKDEASKVFKDVQSNASTMSKGLKVAGGVAAVGIGAAGFALAGFVKQAAAEQVGIERLRVALKNTGASWDTYEKRIDEVVVAGEKLAFSDDQIRDSLSALTAATGDVDEAIRRQEIAMDLARGTGLDLATASKLVGKVSEENTQVLKRYGIELKEGATEQEALAEIQAKFAGQSEAFAETSTAKWEIFNNQMDNIKETIGTALLPVVTTLGEELGDFLTEHQDDIERFSEALAEKIPQAIDAVVEAFKDVQPQLQSGFELIQPALQWVLDNEQALIIAIAAIGAAAIIAFTPVSLPVLAVVGALLLLIYTAGVATDHIDELRQENEDLDQIMRDAEKSVGPLSSAIDHLVQFSLWQWSLILYNISEVMEGLHKIVIPSVNARIGELTTGFNMAKDAALFLWEALEPVRDVLNKIASAAETATTAMNNIPSLPGGVPSPLGLLKKARDLIPFASGGVVPFNNGLQLVGEQGPEIVSLPKGSRIYSNADSRAMMGSGDTTMNVSVAVAIEGDATEHTIDRIRKAVREEAEAAVRAAAFRGSYVTSGAYTPS